MRLSSTQLEQRRLYWISRQLGKLRTSHRLMIFFVFCGGIYLLNMKFTSTFDTIPNSLVPFSLLLHHDVFLERYLNGVDMSSVYYLRPFHDHYISVYPIGAAITALPVYAIYLLFGGHADYFHGLVVAKFAAAIITALSGVVMYKVMKVLNIGSIYRLLFLVLYAFGSETFAISSQGMWQHGPAELWISVFLLMTAKLYTRQGISRRLSYVAGAAMGMLLLTRPQDVIIVLPFLVLLFSKSRRKYVLYAIPVFLIFVAIYFTYNHYFFSTATHYGNAGGIEGRMTAPLETGLLGNLVSPSRGLLIFMPWSIIGILWVIQYRRKTFYRQIYFPSLIAFILYILMYSKLGYWAAGTAYGPRYMTDIMPVTALLSAGFLNQWQVASKLGRQLGRITLDILAFWSILLQILGVFAAQGELWNFAVLPDTFSSGLWSIQNGEIAYYAKTLLGWFNPAVPLVHPKARFEEVRLLDKPSIYTPGTTPLVYKPDTRYSGTAVVKNTGSQTWQAYPSPHGADTVFLGYKVWKADRQVSMASKDGALLHSVRPGQPITIHFYFTTPKTPGTYTYTFTLVQGKNNWFQSHAQGVNAKIMKIRVAAPAQVTKSQ